MKAALYVLHYLHSTHDYGISFTSDSVAPMHSYIHFPPPTDVEAYTNALPLTLTNSSTLSSYLVYSDACWGSQIGNAVADGTLLALFKFRSMSGGIIFRNGGPVGWLGERQDPTSLSSYEAKIRATDATSKKVVDFRNVCQSMVESGHDIADVTSPTLLFNDNNACVQWSYNMTSKAAHHIELQENSVREWIPVKHVSGKLNPSDIFTKEMRDVCTSEDYGTLSCLAFQILSMLPSWRSIMFVSQHFLPSLLLLMLFLRQALFPTFRLLLLLPFADLFRLYLTSPVLVVNSYEVFSDLFHRV